MRGVEVTQNMFFYLPKSDFFVLNVCLTSPERYKIKFMFYSQETTAQAKPEQGGTRVLTPNIRSIRLSSLQNICMQQFEDLRQKSLAI